MPVEKKSSFERREVKKEPDILDSEVQRERLFGQDKKLLDAISYLATRIYSVPPDPKYPDLQPKVLIVGGFVRDALLGLQPKDADVEAYGISPERLTEMLEQMFPGKVNSVGKAFGVLKVKVDEGIEFDVSLPRRESKSGQGHKSFAIQSDPTMSMEDAARRRDFTFNSIAADILSGQIYDPFGGVKDLKERRLRVTDPERFQDDPLRVYRALQFVARMGLTVDDESRKLMAEMVERGTLAELPPERITEELTKLLLKGIQPSRGFELAKELGITEKYFPELHDLNGVGQEQEWHPEGDVWIHTMMATDVAAQLIRRESALSGEDKMQVMLGTLCHDLGKPPTTKIIDGRIRSLDHEEGGIEPTRQFFNRLSYPKLTQTAVELIVAQHLKPPVLLKTLEKGELNEKQYANAVRRLLKRISPVSAKVLCLCSEADVRGRGHSDAMTKPFTAGETMLGTVQKFDLEGEAGLDLIQGRDILEVAKELGLTVKPGPKFGQYVKKINQLRDEGTIETREQALGLLRSWMAEDFKNK